MRPLAGPCAALVLLSGIIAAQEPKQPRFLIVVPEKLSRALGEFPAYKSKTIPTDVLVLESAFARFEGADDAERLKRALHHRYQSAGVRWVLLVGDADVMPVRFMVLDRVTPPAFDYAFYPSDLYYADLTKAGDPQAFEDWNGAKEGFHAGYFGEVRGEKNKKDPINFDAVDWRPEIAVGRWPVSTPAELRIVVEKSMRRDRAAAAREPWLDRCGAVVVGGWIDARSAMDAVAKDLGPRRVEKRYFADAGKKPAGPLPTEDEVVGLLNGGVAFLCHAGHGSDDSWEQCLSAGSIGRLKNADKLPVMMSVGCSTARFSVLPPYEAYADVAGAEHRGTNAGEVFLSPPPPPAVYQRGAFSRTGLGERLLRDGPAGAAAYVGCNTGSQPCAMTLLEGFAKAMGASKAPRAGDCWKAALLHYHDAWKLPALVPNDDWYPPSIFFQGMKFMLFGDPTLLL